MVVGVAACWVVDAFLKGGRGRANAQRQRRRHPPPSQPPITIHSSNGKNQNNRTKPKKAAHWISKAPAAAEKASAQTSSSSSGAAAAIAPRRQRAAVIVCCALLVAWCVRKSMCVCVIDGRGAWCSEQQRAGSAQHTYARALPVTPKNAAAQTSVCGRFRYLFLNNDHLVPITALFTAKGKRILDAAAPTHSFLLFLFLAATRIRTPEIKTIITIKLVYAEITQLHPVYRPGF